MNTKPSMNIPTVDNQNFSENTLKGFLLKNVDPNTQNPTVQILNQYLVKRVDEFWDQAVVPLQTAKKFDGNKINWYFEIYKEGIEARKVRDNPFTFVAIPDEKIAEIVKFFDGKTLLQYLELGTSFLTNCYSLLSSWQRDQLVFKRLKHIYYSSDSSQWILRAEEEEHGIMKQGEELVPGINDIFQNIGLIVSRRA